MTEITTEKRTMSPRADIFDIIDTRDVTVQSPTIYNER